MCNSPSQTPSGQKFACRRCDQCISVRRFDWVSRAMAERQMHPYTIALGLTYGNATQAQRDGAMMFRYSDVQGFFARLRSAIKRQYKIDGAVRYIVAGEQGDRNGRCHYHIIIFSQVDLTTIGEFYSPFGLVKDRDDIVTGSDQEPRRRNWTMWPHGFVTLQEADEGGMHYCLSYALKDQFAADKALGQAREAKSETYATGLFRPSKNPPIGLPYLEQLLHGLRSAGHVQPNTKLKIPDLKGFWYPTGILRKYLLTGFRLINDECIQLTGSNAPQWTSLLHSCRKSETDMEILNGTEESESFADLARDFASRSAFVQSQKDRAKTRRKCGSKVACNTCLRALSRDQLFDLGIKSVETEEGQFFEYWENDENGQKLYIDQWDGSSRGPNKNCFSKSTEHVLACFPYTGRSSLKAWSG